MDGSSWENAIAGNLIYDVDNNKIVEGRVLTTDTRYIGFLIRLTDLMVKHLVRVSCF